MRKADFFLSEIDRKKTRRAVEEELLKFEKTLLTAPLRKKPKVTASFQLVPGGSSNQFSSSTENAAVENLDQERDRIEYIDMMTEIINRLPEDERCIIVKEYMDDSTKFNYEIFEEIGISRSHYYRLKSRAFYKLALMLRIEVYVPKRKVRA